MVGSAAIKQGRSANRKHTYFFWPKQVIKGLIRLPGCAGWSAPLLFEHRQRNVFSHRGPYICMKQLDTTINQTYK